MTETREALKIKKVQVILAKHLGNDGKETVSLPFEVFLREPEFKDPHGVKAILNLLEKHTDSRISWEPLMQERMIPAPTGAAITSYVPPVPLSPIEIGVTVHVSDPKLLTEYFNTAHTEQRKGGRLIEKDQRGNYFYDGQKIDIEKNTIYFNVFDILFLKCDQEGFLSYEQIEEELQERGYESKEGQERNDRIQNATTNENQGLFHSAKLNGHAFKNQTPRGDKLISLRRGKGLILNNPAL